MKTGKTRTIEELVNNHVPFSEMTEDEIEMVIAYRVSLKIRDASYEETMRAMQESREKVIAIHRAASERAKASLDAMVAKALNDE